MPTEHRLSLIGSKSSVRKLLGRCRRPLSQPAAPIVVAGILMVCGGIAMRLVNLGTPDALTFDEHHFVENARNYLRGRADQNDHPPLGKLLIAVGMAVVGDNGLGWRIAPLVFGIASVGMAFVLGRTAFQSRLAGLMAAAFVAADGFLIAYSKSALLDGFLAFFQLLTVYLALRTKAWTGALLTGACWGLAMGIKFSGIVMALPIAVILATRIRPLSRAAVLTVSTGVVALVVYLGQFSLGLGLAGKPYGFGSSLAATWELYQRHAGLTDWKNPLTSRWYSWFIPQKPIMMYREAYGPHWRVMTSLGNLLLWWSSAVAALTCVLVGVRQAVLQFAKRKRPGSDGLGWLYLGICWLAPLVPWWISERDSYIYHYLGSYAFALVCLGGVVEYVSRKLWGLALAFLLAVMLVSAYYAPVWTKTPLTTEQLERRLFKQKWR